MLSLPGEAPIYIIFDDLDECPNFPRNQSAREEVLKLIEVVISEIPNLHLCVASRLDLDARMVLEPFTSFHLSCYLCLLRSSTSRKSLRESLQVPLL
jgi:hypothetical protein